MTTRIIPLSSIHEHPKNPRIDLGDLTDLTAGIRDVGIIEPLVVMPGSIDRPTGMCGDCGQQVPRHSSKVLEEHHANGLPCPGGTMPASDDWYVIAGHRRLAAALAAGLTEAECVTRFDARTTGDQVELMLHENLHRRALTALEEANGFEQLTLEGFTSTRIAQRLKVSKKDVDRRLALATLPEKAKRDLRAGVITLEDAEALIGLEPEKAERALRSIGTKEFRQNLAAERTGSDQRDDIVRELHREYLAPYATGDARPSRAATARVRQVAFSVVARALPPRTVKHWLETVGVTDAHSLGQVDADRALLGLVLALDAGEDVRRPLLEALGYEPSPIELDATEAA